jgi:hypothetical protein
MAKSNRNSGKAWSTQDIDMLKELAKGNTPTGVISIKLGRTENAIRDKASDIKLSLKPTNKPPYNRQQKPK